MADLTVIPATIHDKETTARVSTLFLKFYDLSVSLISKSKIMKFVIFVALFF